MKYPPIWDHLIHNMLKPYVVHCMLPPKQEGFMLSSLLISVTLCLFILLIVISISMSTTIWAARLEDSVSMMEDGRYTRRAIVGHIMWNRNEVDVDSSHHSVAIKDDKKTRFTIHNRALYRQLSDGSLQPVSGSRIIGTLDKRKVDTVSPFVKDQYKALHLSWFINNKFASSTQYAKGYGGIANYEINTVVSTHYNWFLPKTN